MASQALSDAIFMLMLSDVCFDSKIFVVAKNGVLAKLPHSS